MNGTMFNPELLSKKELQAYSAMNSKEKTAFENRWIRLQELKDEMLDKVEKTNHRTRQREAREKVKQRKVDTHRKIVNGSILEVYLPDELKELDKDNPNQNTALKEFFDYVFATPYVKEKMERFKSNKNEHQDFNGF